MMQIQIKNFGPISEASICIGGLTIFTGANNTGKSFASRLVFSILNSLQSDLYIERASQLLSSLHRPYSFIDLDTLLQRIRNRGDKASKIVDSIREIISRTNSKVQSLDLGEISSKDVITLLENAKSDLENNLDSLRPLEPNGEIDRIMHLLHSYLRSITEFLEQVSKENIHDNFIEAQLKSNIESELTGNFRIPSIAELFGPKRAAPSIKLIGNNNNISFTLAQSGITPEIRLTNANIGKYYPSNLFLESPIYWNLGDGALHERHSFTDTSSSNLRLPISDIPAYVSSLRSSLNFELSGEVAFPDILKWIKEKNAFKGGLVATAWDQLLYHDGRRQFPLQTTSAGITNIAIIKLLIERKQINESTVLFFDKPESNLHPAWQVLMIQLLLKLAQAGVDVIVTTHSVDILKFIEVSAKIDPAISNLIHLNHFPNPKDSNKNFFNQIREIQDELSDPYYRLYIGDV